MNLETLARLGEFVGGFFVVISLVYLAYQVRQNTKSLRAENYARVLERLSTVQSNLSADGQLNRIVILGAQKPEALTPAERTRLSWALYELLGCAEFVYHQTLEDALPDEVWQRWRATLAWWLSHPGIRAWWEAKATPFSATFETLVEQLTKEGVADPEAAKRWEDFVAGAAPGSSD